MKIVTKMVLGVVVLGSSVMNAAEFKLEGCADGVKANLLNKPGQRFAEFTVLWSQRKTAKQKPTNSALSISEVEAVAAVSELQDASSLAVTHMRDYLGLDPKKCSKIVADIIATHFAKKKIQQEQAVIDPENRAEESEISEEKKKLRAAMAAVFYQITGGNDFNKSISENRAARLKEMTGINFAPYSLSEEQCKELDKEMNKNKNTKRRTIKF